MDFNFHFLFNSNDCLVLYFSEHILRKKIFCYHLYATAFKLLHCLSAWQTCVRANKQEKEGEGVLLAVKINKPIQTDTHFQMHF